MWINKWRVTFSIFQKDKSSRYSRSFFLYMKQKKINKSRNCEKNFFYAIFEQKLILIKKNFLATYFYFCICFQVKRLASVWLSFDCYICDMMTPYMNWQVRPYFNLGIQWVVYSIYACFFIFPIFNLFIIK